MVISDFTVSRIPELYFGPGEFSRLGKLCTKAGKNILLVTGFFSLRSSGYYDKLKKMFDRYSINLFECRVKGEPSPVLVDSAVKEFSVKNIKLVAAIGGGSVIDTGKAISAMLPLQDSVVQYLEGVGTKKHPGDKIPFVAVPTTAGTGSEATKNAVISRVGIKGFKKSLRHNNFIPDCVIIDPELSLSCPPEISAACGMDALTQLIESYVSTNSSPLTDVLALNGLKYIKDSLIPVSTNRADNIEYRSGMAWAAFLSGITLANAGLGIVHGMASPAGAYFNIPHGVFCGTMIGAATELNIRKLKELNDNGSASLEKYSQVGHLLSGSNNTDINAGCILLIDKLNEWTDHLKLPLLSKFGIESSHLVKIAEDTGNKNNPVKLNQQEIIELLRKRLV